MASARGTLSEVEHELCDPVASVASDPDSAPKTTSTRSIPPRLYAP
jgi:hypothetical protein